MYYNNESLHCVLITSDLLTNLLKSFYARYKRSNSAIRSKGRKKDQRQVIFMNRMYGRWTESLFVTLRQLVTPDIKYFFG